MRMKIKRIHGHLSHQLSTHRQALRKCFSTSSSSSNKTHGDISEPTRWNWYQSVWLKSGTLNCQIPHYETWPRYFPLMRYCLDDAHYHSNLSYALGLLWSSLSTFSLDFVCCNLCRSFIMRMELPWKPVAPGTIDCRSTADIDSTVDSPGPSFKSSRGECIYRVPLNKQVRHSLALHATEDPHKSKEG